MDQSLFAVIMEAYLHGTSAREVDDLVKVLGADSGITRCSRTGFRQLQKVWYQMYLTLGMRLTVFDTWYLPSGRSQVMLVLWAALERGMRAGAPDLSPGTAKRAAMRMRLRMSAALDVVAVTIRAHCYKSASNSAVSSPGILRLIDQPLARPEQVHI